MPRYQEMPEDREVVICRDCSTRTRLITIPSDETHLHDKWHDEEHDPSKWWPVGHPMNRSK